jgi:homopolymeric O-antigen transport system ATP-binding protein
MSNTILKATNISKQYRLGVIGTGTLSHDLNRWWSKVRGKDDPFLKVGEVNDRSTTGESNYVWALQDINFEVQRGEVLGIIGKNGAGKSTLLKLLSRVTSPSTGEIKTKGRIASLLEVGTGFHPELTGRENIYLNGAILGMTKAEIKIKEAEIIDFSGCERYIDTPVKRYSSGMTVRLAFAVAAHLEPDILVVDEVLAVGDAEFQKKAIGKMQDISKGEGRTVLFVSHNMAAVKSLCTRAMVLEHGKMVFEGNTDEAVNFYLSNKELVVNSNLGELKNRIGNGEVKFCEFYLENDEGKIVNQVLNGEAISLCFKVKANNLKTVKTKIDIGFSIHTLDEQVIAVLYSSYQSIILDIIEKGEYLVKCKLSNIAFNEGEYIVRGRILSNNEESDWLKEPLGILNVVKGDFYQTGNLGFVGKSKVLIKGEWELIA